MMTAQLFFTSIDDIVLVANDSQKINLSNYNREIHSDIFGGLQSFLRISSSSQSMNQRLGSCFNETAAQFILDQQTMLNIRILLEVMKQSDIAMARDVKDVFENLKKSFEKDKHASIVKLEKTLTQENCLEYLKFFNTENNLVQDELSTNYIEKVGSFDRSRSPSASRLSSSSSTSSWKSATAKSLL